jgi:RNA polymerase sigma-70 factor (ECF subfamily)
MPDWQQIVDEQGPAAYRIARRILGNAADAEDVCQEVFAEVFRVVSSRMVVNLPGLVRRLASLRAVDQLRKRKATVPLDEELTAHDVAGPQELAVANELAERLRTALARLPEQQAAVFALRYFEHLTNAEIAAALDTTQSAVSTALSKARERLVRMLHHQQSGT